MLATSGIPLIESFSDFLTYFNNIKIPSGNLGVSRSMMPQIDSQHVPDYIEWLKSKGITVDKEQVPVNSLRLCQNEINKNKVVKLIQDGIRIDQSKPIIISSDGFVIDGSHRLVAQLNTDSNSKINALRVNMKAMDLLQLSRKFPNAVFRNVSGLKVAA
jgi:hypothetical protein